MTQRQGAGERNVPASYGYDIGPARATGSAPFYGENPYGVTFRPPMSGFSPAKSTPRRCPDRSPPWLLEN